MSADWLFVPIYSTHLRSVTKSGAGVWQYGQRDYRYCVDFSLFLYVEILSKTTYQILFDQKRLFKTRQKTFWTKFEKFRWF